MEINLFKQNLKEYLNKINLEIDDEKSMKLFNYMNKLISENEKLNLTAITKPEEIIDRHFMDSLTIYRYLKKDSKVIDVGTGAGFPGIPNAIYDENLKIYLLDSLNKRISFLNKVKEENNLKNVETLWGRAEDFGQNKEYREQFDFAVSRAVAPLEILAEYLIPFVKVDGKCICMKGPKFSEEIANIDSVLEKLGAKLEKVDDIEIDGMHKYIIIIKKVKKTDKKYPRKAGIPSKKPLK